MISSAIVSNEFFGRHEELEVLEEEFRTASDGRARFVLVEGEAGIGKSRLLREFARRIEKNATVAFGHSSEHIRRPYLPLQPVTEAVSRGRLVPKASDRAFNAEEKAAHFEAFGAAIQRESMRRPIFAVLEDAQWADEATLELLRYLAASVGNAHLLFAISLRTADAMTNAALAALRLSMARARATTVSLRGLRRTEMRNLVGELVRARETELRPDLFSQIEHLSEGNPFFAEELTRMALENGELAFRENMPLSVQATLSERLSYFSESERDILIRAAIAGQTFRSDFVATVAEVPQAEVLAAVQRAVSSGLLVASPESPQHFTFRHALIRQALAEQVVVALAAPLHVRIAEAIEREPMPEARASELAYHYTQARVAEKARTYNELAGQSAMAVYAYRDAIRFYTAALKWEYPAGAARAALYERIGQLLYIEGVGEEPARWFERSREEHAALGNRAGVSHALLLLADQHWVDARTGQSLRDAADAAHMALNMGRTELAAEATLSRARFATTLGDAPTALEHLQTVSAMNADLDIPMQAMWFEVRAETRAAIGDGCGALRDCDRASKLAAQTGSSELIAQVENNCALVAADLGELARAEQHHRISMNESRRTGMMWRVAYCAMNYARTLALKGQLTEARALVFEALRCGVTTATFKTKAASVGIPLALALNDRQLLEACADEEAMTYAARSSEIQRMSAVAAAFAELRNAQGAGGEARHVLTEALHTISRGHRSGALWFQAAQLGGPQELARAQSVLSNSTGRPRMLRVYRLILEAHRVRAQDSERSRRLAELASRAFAAVGFRWHAAYCSEFAGHVQEAEAEYRAMGAVRDIQRLGAKRRVRPERRLDLTARQRQIAELVARGETNREIASALHISEHTVEHHLSTIFSRIGVKSRAQLSACIGAEMTA